MVFSRNRTPAQFCILPPSAFRIQGIFQKIHNDRGRYSELLAELQRFRGRIYLRDGAIQPQELTSERQAENEDAKGTNEDG